MDKDIEDLNTSYKANWSGPLIGFKFDAALRKRLHLETDLSYHQLKYAAKANWNLIE
ncbi:hypothetical protein I5M32_14345 [Pedobacter sp. SD-b]|uniref:Protochlamydia outer membrane protein domain-containing protein n=1 Tax=Pedobacter segetis TaxID=2793069 RepID=A0ABS1BP52_9SPHI|nr:hypothetical protein [Pedobacter segetis]MBK0384146.1 hypothetical protein [Pedobacter segetis]